MVQNTGVVSNPSIAVDRTGRPHVAYQWADALHYGRRLFVGVEEGCRPQASSFHLQPSILRHLPAGAVVLDAMGRRVLGPEPGVYFVRRAYGVGREASSVTKVVVAR